MRLTAGWRRRESRWRAGGGCSLERAVGVIDDVNGWCKNGREYIQESKGLCCRVIVEIGEAEDGVARMRTQRP
jgi:hypothetical protein